MDRQKIVEKLIKKIFSILIKEKIAPFMEIYSLDKKMYFIAFSEDGEKITPEDIKFAVNYEFGYKIDLNKEKLKIETNE